MRRSFGPAAIAAALALLPAAASAQPSMRVGHVFRDSGEPYSMNGKGQAKVAWVDGAWWGAFSSASGVDLFRLQGTRWVKETFPGSHVSDDSDARADVVWDGTQLLVLLNERIGNANTLRLHVYTYVRPSFRVRSGFPVVVVAGTTTDPFGGEVHTVAKDSTGRLWVAYRANSEGRVKCSSGTGPSGWTSWRPPVVMGYLGAGISDTGSVSQVLAFDSPTGPRIGVIWSDQSAPPNNAYRFRSRRDAASLGIEGWDPEEIAYQNGDEPVANDQVHAVHFEGRLYAIVKTDLPPSQANVGRERFLLLIRHPDGTWQKITVRLIERAGDTATRGQVAIDGENRRIYLFWHDIAIEGKVASVDNPSFLDKPLFSYLAPWNETNWNAQTTHQILNTRTDLLLVADDASSGWQYWNKIELGTPEAQNPVPTLSTLTVSPEIVSVGTGGQVTFVARGRDQRGNAIEVAPTWHATGGTIDPTGLYTAGTVAGVYGVAASMSETGHATVYVGANPIVDRIEVRPSPITIRVNETLQLTAVGIGPQGELVSLGDTPVTWRLLSGSGSLSSTGLYTAPATETRVTVSATALGMTGYSSILVFPAPPPPTGGGGDGGSGETGPLARIVVSPGQATVPVGGTQQFTAQGQDAQGRTVSFAPTWSASGGTIGSTGLFTAGQETGSFQVVASSGGVSGAATVDVAPVSSELTLAPPRRRKKGGCAAEPGEGEGDLAFLLPLLILGIAVARRRLAS